VPFSLKIIGDGVDVKSAMETEIAKLGLQPQVTFTGWLSQQEVLKAMNAADILMLTSNYEGMPISMMEALACGCGFVGTRVSGIEDYEHHVLAPDCFRVFEVGELEVAVKQIQDIASIPKRRRRKAATELAKEQFSMQTCIANYIKAFSSIPLSTDYKRGIASIGVTVLLKSFVLSYIRFFKMVLRNK
jgi:glycosyltransferase involved in cell wall biosynthesis